LAKTLCQSGFEVVKNILKIVRELALVKATTPNPKLRDLLLQERGLIGLPWPVRRYPLSERAIGGRNSSADLDQISAKPGLKPYFFLKPSRIDNQLHLC
jgi:hypothetical protein